MRISSSKLITVKLAQKLLGIGEYKIKHWMANGTVPVVRLKGTKRIYIPTDWVKAYRQYKFEDIPNIKADRVDKAQAAILLGCSFITVSRHVRSGKIKHYRTLGGKVLIPLTEIERLLVNQKYYQRKPNGKKRQTGE